MENSNIHTDNKKKRKKETGDNLNDINHLKVDYNKEYRNYIKLAIENINNKQFSLKPQFYMKSVSAINEENYSDIIGSKHLISKNLDDYMIIQQTTNVMTVSYGEIFYKYLYNKHHKSVYAQPIHTMREESCGICLSSLFEIEKEEVNSILEEKVIIDISDDNINSTQSSNKALKDLFIDDLSVIKLSKCENHYFHTTCMKILLHNKLYIKCPICARIYGIMTGDQPQGTMKGKIINSKCSGYSCDTIQITYNFPDGVRNNIRYSGTTRVCYLPLCEEGIDVCGLLIESFKRKLTFTVGTSLTTGISNTTIWNGVHHKTSLYGGCSNFGYPDSSYFLRVTQELNSKGVVKSGIMNLKKQVEEFLGIILM